MTEQKLVTTWEDNGYHFVVVDKKIYVLVEEVKERLDEIAHILDKEEDI